MRAPRAVVALVGSMVAFGCGRFGFENPGGGIADDDDQPCTVLSTTVSEGTTRADEPAVVWNGTRFGVTWLEDTMPQSAHFRALSLDGPSDPIADLGVAGEPAQVAWDGASWRLAWANNATNPEIMLSTDGAASRALTANARSDTTPRVAAMSGGTIAYLWRTDATTNNVRLTIIDKAGAKLVDDRAIATTTVGRLNLAWTGSELVAFYDVAEKLMMLRMNAGGTPIGSATAVVTVPPAGPPFGAFDRALAAWAGDRFLVAWMAADEFRFTYVRLDGTQVFPSVRVAGYGGFSGLVPSLAVGPQWDALVYDNVLGYTSYLLEVFRDGTLGKPHVIEQANYPSATWVGTTWAVVVSQRQPPVAGMPVKPNYIKLVQLCR